MHAAATNHFPAIERTYLDTASYGLPPTGTTAVLRQALDTWAAGSANWTADWDPAGDRCRRHAAELFGAPAEEIALIPAVSVGVAVVLTSIGPGDEILLPDDEFASVLLPALVVARERGATIRRVDF
ncbi:MAG: aminotransferase class V-fold PLP-dependent enzyme, partial [Chloroflexota bacterium]